MEPLLSATLVEAVRFLDAENVRYALIGGLAASLRGQPRVTADVDLVIAADIPRALLLLNQITDKSFQPLFPDAAEVVERAFILPLRHRTTQIKVDLALGLSGFEQQAITRATPLQVADTRVFVATAEDILLMKVLAGRPQDDQDIYGLMIAQGDQLDWNYCEQTAAELGEALGQNLKSRIQALRGRY